MNDINNIFKLNKSISTNVTMEDDNHPVIKYKRIVNELDLIEKDLKLYQDKVRYL